MVSAAQLLQKCRAVATKGPATLRNIVYSKLGIWPVGRLESEQWRDLPTYCISLTRATERRRLMLSQAAGMGLTNFQFINAVEAKILDYDKLVEAGLYDDSKARCFHGAPLSLNEIAASLSHGLAYQRIVERGDPLALVLEDDALFLTGRVNQISLARLPADSEIVYLNTFREAGTPADRIDGTLFGVEAYTGSAAAYLLTQTGARKLAAIHKPVVHAADGLLGRLMPAPEGKPHPFKQVGVDTILQSYMIYPDCVLNGSVCHYYGSYIAATKARTN